VALSRDVRGLLHLRERVGLKYDIGQADCQMILRALAIQGICYPGLEYSNREIAKHLSGEEMYDQFRGILKDTFDTFDTWALDLDMELADEMPKL